MHNRHGCNSEGNTIIALMTSIIIFVLILMMALAVCGCTNPNTGSSTVVCDQISLPEISDSSDSVSVRVYESVKGAKVWTAKDSVVTIDYACATTNSYFGLVDTTSDMTLSVTIDPLSQQRDNTAPTPNGNAHIQKTAKSD